jgi:hypothetical protein
LLDGDLNEVREFSRKLTLAINQLAESVQRIDGTTLVFAGGDDICFMIEQSVYDDRIIQSLMLEFNELTGIKISFGVGPSIEAAYLNLSRAKAGGAGTLVATRRREQVNSSR